MAVPGAPHLELGSIFHYRYRVIAPIRIGGMGAVYEVEHTGTQRRLALKAMLAELVTDSDARRRFAQEARVTAKIESDHIVQVVDAGVDEATAVPFIVMELLRGSDLGILLTRRGRFPPGEVVSLLYQAALALDKTHEAEIVHRDLKPENLHVGERDDGEPHLKILDFGIAKVIPGGSLFETTRTVGSPLYMAPEQIEGDGLVDGRADLYALGHVAYTLLVGKAYHEVEASKCASAHALLWQLVHGPRVPASERACHQGALLPSTFDGWFERATAKEPSGRFESASALVSALAQSLDVEPPAAEFRHPPGATEGKKEVGTSWARARRVGVRVAALAGAITIVGISASIFGQRWFGAIASAPSSMGGAEEAQERGHLGKAAHDADGSRLRSNTAPPRVLQTGASTSSSAAQPPVSAAPRFPPALATLGPLGPRQRRRDNADLRTTPNAIKRSTSSASSMLGQTARSVAGEARGTSDITDQRSSTVASPRSAASSPAATSSSVPTQAPSLGDDPSDIR